MAGDAFDTLHSISHDFVRNETSSDDTQVCWRSPNPTPDETTRLQPRLTHEPPRPYPRPQRKRAQRSRPKHTQVEDFSPRRPLILDRNPKPSNPTIRSMGDRPPTRTSRRRDSGHASSTQAANDRPLAGEPPVLQLAHPDHVVSKSVPAIASVGKDIVVARFEGMEGQVGGSLLSSQIF